MERLAGKPWYDVHVAHWAYVAGHAVAEGTGRISKFSTVVILCISHTMNKEARAATDNDPNVLIGYVGLLIVLILEQRFHSPV